MEIPYVVTPRKDTGLVNSKIGLWLFLASEVMLFGGFFSAYVFLRMDADYPWPERTLPVLPGLINTFVLIASSVTVVFAWASLKLRNWRNYKIFMGTTILCAVIFMGLKAVEYRVKLNHQAVRLNDYTVLEGHLSYRKDGDGFEYDYRGKRVEDNRVAVKAEQLTFNTLRVHKPWLSDILHQAAAQNAKIALEADVVVKNQRGGDAQLETIATAGEVLTPELIDRLEKVHLVARTNNAEIINAAQKRAWKAAHRDNPGKRGWEISSEVSVDSGELEDDLFTEVASVAFSVVPAARLEFRPRDVREGPNQSRLRDGTMIQGELVSSPMRFEHIDAIDFQHLAMKAVERGFDPLDVIEDSWLLANNPFARDVWEWHQGQVATEEQRLLEKYGIDESTGLPRREPTLKERYRIGWKELAHYAEERGARPLSKMEMVKEEFTGPNYHARGAETFPAFEVPRDQVAYAAKFSPAWNTYYAIYFTLTGLHGIHVIGGALVLSYFFFFGRKMYLANPEWLAGRVEVAGLFWHFVDIIWIFAFPILYLM